MKFLYKKIMTYCCRIFCVKVDKKDIEMEFVASLRGVEIE